MRLRIVAVGCLLLLLAAGLTPAAPITKPARAQQVERIAAIVNDDIISMYDLVSRLRMVIVTSRLPDTPEVRQRLVPQVLRSLIDEQLQLQEAKRLNLSVSEREIDRAIAQLEQQNNLPQGQFGAFLEQANLEESTVVDQIRANFAWQKVVAQRIRPQVRISEEEIDEVLRQMSRNQGSMQYRVAEIFLSVDSPEQEQSVRETAQRLSQQIRGGADFAVLARQFSQSASADAGGDVGWVQRGQINSDLEEALTRLAPGRVSDPVRTRAGYFILLLRERRTLEAKPPDQLTVTLRQINLKHPENASADDIIAQKELAETISQTASGCDDMAKLSNELGVSSSAGPIKVKVQELSDTIRPVALGLEVGEPSAPISNQEGFSVIMVCQRDEAASLPNRDEIRETLIRERMNVLMRRYLRDLRLGAFLEVRV